MNLPIHAYNSESRVHAAARAWWEGLLNGTQPVGLPWVTALGFIRLTTHRQILVHPLEVAIACGHVRKWLARPCVAILHPGDHLDGIESLLAEMHIRLETRSEEVNDDPAQHARLAMIEHLLQQACALLVG